MTVKTKSPYSGLANVYEQIRPEYPTILIDDVITNTQINARSRLLEIGAGTGKATSSFLNRGYNIHAIEPDQAMADILKSKFSDKKKISIDISSFESWKQESDDTYDLVFCAQAFHWINKEIKYQKTFDLLHEKGKMALFWYNAKETKTKENSLIHQEINEVIKRFSNISKEKDIEERAMHSGVSKKESRKKELLDSGLYQLVFEKEYFMTVKNTPEQFLLAQKSFPEFASMLDKMDEEAIKRMDKEITGVIERHNGYTQTDFEFYLLIAEKIQQ